MRESKGSPAGMTNAHVAVERNLKNVTDDDEFILLVKKHL